MKNYFIGLTLAPSSIVDSGVVVVDRNNEIIFMDKLYTMNDVRFFFENFASLKDSQVCVSIPQDNTLINGKWRLLSKHYQMVNSNDRILNTDNWTERFSHRGSDLFLELKEKGISINRYGIYLTRQALGLVSHIKDRSPGDCKFLQTMLKTRFGFENLPSNMVPMAQLEAILGAIVARRIDDGVAQTAIFTYRDLDVIKC